MDANLLIASFLFGVVGMAMFVYGKRAGRVVPLAAGAALMALPTFIPSLTVMIAVCTIVAIAPWLI